MKTSLLFLFLLGLSILNPTAEAYAADCGFPPTNEPNIPNGQVATSETMQAAVQSLRDYAALMNAHLDCLETNREEKFRSMNAEQQERWVEDYNTLFSRLQDFENQLNEQIRVFNARN